MIRCTQEDSPFAALAIMAGSALNRLLVEVVRTWAKSFQFSGALSEVVSGSVPLNTYSASIGQFFTLLVPALTLGAAGAFCFLR